MATLPRTIVLCLAGLSVCAGAAPGPQQELASKGAAKAASLPVQAAPEVAVRRARIADINEKIRRARLQTVRIRPLDLSKLVLLSPDLWTDLRPTIDGYQLPVRDQGPWGTCSVHALAFCQEYMTAAKTGQKGLNYSPEYLNWAGNAVNGKPYCDGGFYSDLDKGYQSYGAVGEAAAPYQAAFNANWAPAAATITAGKQALRHTATFIKPWNNTMGASQIQLEEAIAQIKAKRPVALGALWPNTFEVQAVDGVDLMKVPARAATFDGHSVVLVGFHRSAKYPGGGYFIFRNSWGKTWGDAGIGYMPFKYVLDLANDLLVYK